MAAPGRTPTPRRASTRRAQGRTTPSPERRAQIIAAAIQVIARDGIRACTVSALEHETGFARGHFSYHFAAKEEIIGLAFATVAGDWATTQIEAPEGATAAAWIEHRVRAAVEWAQRRPDFFRCLMNFRVEMMRNPDAFPRAKRVRQQMWDLAAQRIRDGVADGTLRPRGDPRVEARTLFATTDAMVMHAAMDESFCPPGGLSDYVWSVVAERLGATTSGRCEPQPPSQS